jgi:hypothetical protein
MKYMIRRWSNTTGGPGGPPSYTGGGSAVTAAGLTGNIQYNNGGLLAGNPNFNIDVADLSFGLNGLKIGVLSSALVLADNTVIPASLFTYLSSFKFVVIEYSVDRNSFSRVGRLMIANDGAVTSISNDFVETGVTGASFFASIVGPNVQISYTTTSTGNAGTFKYAIRKWS